MQKSQINTKVGSVSWEGTKWLVRRYEMSCKKVRSVQGTKCPKSLHTFYFVPWKGTKCPGYEVAKVRSVLTPAYSPKPGSNFLQMWMRSKFWRHREVSQELSTVSCCELFIANLWGIYFFLIRRKYTVNRASEFSQHCLDEKHTTFTLVWLWGLFDLSYIVLFVINIFTSSGHYW